MMNQKETKCNRILNATFIIGNGFDIGVLTALKETHKTSYIEFYNYLEFFLINKQNIIYQEIKKNEKYMNTQNESLWTDFEKLLGKLFEENIGTCTDKETYLKIIGDFEEIQYQFADFMNQVITPNILKAVSKLDGQKTLESFVFDLNECDFETCQFHIKVDNHMQLNYNFINFNYSTLFDNYIYWHFDPHPFKKSENNSFFYNQKESALNKLTLKDVESKERRNHFKFIKTTHTIFHPHGHIAIPSSILFGTSENGTYESTVVDSETSNYFQEELRKRIDKPYWSQAKNTYASVINNTDLFVIYGHSIGETDAWWWREIIEHLDKNREAEVIIYQYTDNSNSRQSKTMLSETLLKYAQINGDVESVKERIYTIEFSKEKPLKFGFTFDV